MVVVLLSAYVGVVMPPEVGRPWSECGMAGGIRACSSLRRRYAARRSKLVLLVWEIDLGARPTSPVSASALSSLNPGTCFVSAVAGSPPRWMKRLAPICDSSCGPFAAHPTTHICMVPPPRRTAAPPQPGQETDNDVRNSVHISSPHTLALVDRRSIPGANKAVHKCSWMQKLETELLLF